MPGMEGTSPDITYSGIAGRAGPDFGEVVDHADQRLMKEKVIKNGIETAEDADASLDVVEAMANIPLKPMTPMLRKEKSNQSYIPSTNNGSHMLLQERMSPMHKSRTQMHILNNPRQGLETRLPSRLSPPILQGQPSDNKDSFIRNHRPLQLSSSSKQINYIPKTQHPGLYYNDHLQQQQKSLIILTDALRKPQHIAMTPMLHLPSVLTNPSNSQGPIGSYCEFLKANFLRLPPLIDRRVAEKVMEENRVLKLASKRDRAIIDMLTDQLMVNEQ